MRSSTRLRRAAARWFFPAFAALGIAAYPISRSLNLYNRIGPPPAPRNSPAPPEPVKTVYPYSVVRGGVHSPEQVWQAIYDDPIVAVHYADMRLKQLRPMRPERPILAHVSYRIGDEVYWTRTRHNVAAGETLLGDGENLIRARCGNRVSLTPQLPVRDSEPTEEMLETARSLPEPRVATAAPGLPDSPYFSWFAPKAAPPLVEFPIANLPQLGIDQFPFAAVPAGGSGHLFPGLAPPGAGLIGGTPASVPVLVAAAPVATAPTQPEVPPLAPPELPGAAGSVPWSVLPEPGYTPPATLSPPSPDPGRLPPAGVITPPGTAPPTGFIPPRTPSSSVPPGELTQPVIPKDNPSPPGIVTDPPIPPPSDVSEPLSPVPEPGTALLLLAGLCALALRRR